MKIELLDTPGVSQVLLELLEKHEEIYIACAWGYNGPIAERLLEQRGKFRSVTFGLEFSQTDPALVDRLIGVPNAYVAVRGKGTFHPKIYLFRTGNIAEAIVGSSNFTHGGLERNYEACVHVTGLASDDFFTSLQILLESYDGLRRAVSNDLARQYRLHFNAASKVPRPKSPAFSDELTYRLSAPLISMGWDEYVRIMRSSIHCNIEERLRLLRQVQAWFSNSKSSGELTATQWKAVAGVIGDRQKREANLDAFDWAWFGSMRGAGEFSRLVGQQNSDLVSAIDNIPKRGDVTRSQYDLFCGRFAEAFTGAGRKGGVPTATRLLSMKRPDCFICISSLNIAGLSSALHFKTHSLNLSNYWEKVIEPIRVSKWYNQDRPLNHEADLWDARVAMLDAIYYQPR